MGVPITITTTVIIIIIIAEIALLCIYSECLHSYRGDLREREEVRVLDKSGQPE